MGGPIVSVASKVATIFKPKKVAEEAKRVVKQTEGLVGKAAEATGLKSSGGGGGASPAQSASAAASLAPAAKKKEEELTATPFALPLRRGRTKTVFTSALGLSQQANVARKTLLGQ